MYEKTLKVFCAGYQTDREMHFSIGFVIETLVRVHYVGMSNVWLRDVWVSDAFESNVSMTKRILDSRIL